MGIGDFVSWGGKKFGQVVGMQDVPDPVIVPLDAETQGLLNQGVDRASRSPEEFAANLNQGVLTGAGQLGQSQEQGQQEAQRLGDTYSDAIRQSYAAKSQDSIGRLIKANEYKAKLQKGDQMRQMSQAAMAQQNVATQNYAMLTEAYNQSEMARANFVSQIFQTGNQAMAARAAQTKKSNNQAMVSDREYAGAAVGGGGYGMTESGPEYAGGISVDHLRRYENGGNYGY